MFYQREKNTALADFISYLSKVLYAFFPVFFVVLLLHLCKINLHTVFWAVL